MIEITKQLLSNQYEAALCTLQSCVVNCPDSLWQTKVVRYPVSQVVFHTLFFADYYLEAQEGEIEKQPFHQDHKEWFADYEQLEYREPTSTYEKEDILRYLAHCREKAVRVVASEDEQTLKGPTGFTRRDFSRAELHVYNVRHIQHHAAQIIMRLRLESDVDIGWFGSGWMQ